MPKTFIEYLSSTVLVLIAVFLLSMVGEKHGSTSFRKKLKLSRISFETAGTYRVVAKGKYCQFEKNVEVRVISKYSSLPKPRLNLKDKILYLVLFELTWSRGSFLSFFLEGWVDREKDWEKISENATLKGSHWFWAEHWTDTRKIQNRSPRWNIWWTN